MKKRDHPIHKYKRVDLATTKDKSYLVFRCVLNCSHYILAPLIIGKESLCWSCEKPFSIKSKEVVKPKCENCIRHRENPEVAKAKEILIEMGIVK
jgi:hypothetical protein